MVLKSTKSKSKRSTLRHKYKVIRKVKEHHKKKAKEERKRKKAGLRPKKTKDPGIPAQWPFKDELLKDLEWQKQRILAQEKAKRTERKLKRAAEAELKGGDEDMPEQASLEDLQEAALQKQKEHAAKKPRLTKPLPGDDRDGSRRAFFKEFVKVVTAADVVIEVLDARDPLGSRCEEVERFVRRTGAGKRVILLLNKIDLVPREIAEAWLKYLREEAPTVAFKCSTQQQATRLKQARGRQKGGRRKNDTPLSSAPQTSDCLGAETLLQLLKNYARSADIKTAITVGVVGLPNVGKSSLINSLKRARVAQVGNAPGVTRAVQQVNLDRHINLLDSPGIALAAAQPGDAWAALRNCVKVEQLPDPQAAAAEVVRRCPAKQLMALYSVPAFGGPDEFLQHVAFKRGRLLPGGVGDAATAARIVLHDWHNGKIAYFTRPPTRGDGTHEAAELVSSWGQDFDAEKVFANERSAVTAGLAPLDDPQKTFIPTESAGASLIDLEGMQNDAASDSSDSEQDASASSEDEDDEGGTPALTAVPSSAEGGTTQAAQLYSEIGQFNPHAARAAKKRRRQQRRVRFGDDFDFAEAFADEVKLGNDGRADGEASQSDEGDELLGAMSEGDEIPDTV